MGIDADWALVVLTAVLALATIWLVLATRELANDSSRAAEQAYQQARRANDLAESAFIAANRPWLGYARMGPQTDDEGEILSVIGELRNYGKMPATDIRMQYHGILLDPGQEPSPAEIAPDAVPSVMFPSAHCYVPFIPENSLITPEIFEQIRNRQKVLWLTSTIVYDFPGNTQGPREAVLIAKYHPEHGGFGSDGLNRCT